MRKLLCFSCLFFVLGMLVPASSSAVVNSSDLPQDKIYPPLVGCAAGTYNTPFWTGTRVMLVRISYDQNKKSYIWTPTSPVLTPCLAGAAQINDVVVKLCQRAFIDGYTVLSIPGDIPINEIAPTDCATLTNEDDEGFKAIGGDPAHLQPCGFRITNDSGADDPGALYPRFVVDNDTFPGGCSYDGLFTAANGGNTVIPDLLRQYVGQVQVNGDERVCQGGSNAGTACTSSPALCLGGGTCADTRVRWTLTAIGGATTTLAEVNLANFIGDSAGLHLALRDQLHVYFASLTGDPSVVSNPSSSRYSHFPGEYVPGPRIRVNNINGDLSHIGIEILSGGTAGSNLKIAQETSQLNLDSPVPALNPWGVAALVATLLLSSLWFLRRRARLAKE